MFYFELNLCFYEKLEDVQFCLYFGQMQEIQSSWNQDSEP